MMADEKKVLRLLKTARGQMDGIIKMVEENRYCIDISQQLMATAGHSQPRQQRKFWPPT